MFSRILNLWNLIFFHDFHLESVGSSSICTFRFSNICFDFFQLILPVENNNKYSKFDTSKSISCWRHKNTIFLSKLFFFEFNLMRKLFKGGNYSRAETVRGNTLTIFFIKRTLWDFFFVDSQLENSWKHVMNTNHERADGGQNGLV